MLDNKDFSYSGIVDIIHHQPEKIEDLVIEIDNRYNDLKSKQDQLEKELDNIKAKKSKMISSFFYTHKAMSLGEEPLTFFNEDRFVIVNILSEENNRVEYNSFLPNIIVKQ